MDGALIHHTHRMESVSEEVAIAEGTGGARHVGRGMYSGTATWRSQDDGRAWAEPVFLAGVLGQ